jgi:hypothetical protein
VGGGFKFEGLLRLGRVVNKLALGRDTTVVSGDGAANVDFNRNGDLHNVAGCSLGKSRPIHDEGKVCASGDGGIQSAGGGIEHPILPSCWVPWFDRHCLTKADTEIDKITSIRALEAASSLRKIYVQPVRSVTKFVGEQGSLYNIMPCMLEVLAYAL